MNLAFHDVRHHFGRFVATSAVVGLLFTVVLAMAGIYQGLVDDATVLLDRMHADLWVVQRGTRGPFADPSRLDPSFELRAASVPGVVSARAFTTQILQRDHARKQLRFALVGLAFPDDRGDELSVTQGRSIVQAHGELIADASLGVAVGEVLHLGRDDYRVVGLTKQVLASGGDAVVFATVADTQRIVNDDSSDALIAERQRRLARLQATDLGRGQPALGDLAVDPRWTFPALSSSPIQAVLVRTAPARLNEVLQAFAGWSDVSVWTRAEEEQLVLQGMVAKARMQLGVFAAILIVSSSLLLAAVLYSGSFAGCPPLVTGASRPGTPPTAWSSEETPPGIDAVPAPALLSAAHPSAQRPSTTSTVESFIVVLPRQSVGRGMLIVVRAPPGASPRGPPPAADSLRRWRARWAARPSPSGADRPSPEGASPLPPCTQLQEGRAAGPSSARLLRLAWAAGGLDPKLAPLASRR